MHKHRETGKIVRVLNMDTDTTYQDEDGHSKTLDTAHFNSLYEETLETGSFGADDVSVAELLVEIDRMKQVHAVTVEALNKDIAAKDVAIGGAKEAGQVQAARIAELEGQVSELTKPKETTKK